MKPSRRSPVQASVLLPLAALSISWTLLFFGDPQILYLIKESLNVADLSFTPPPAPRLPPELYSGSNFSIFRMIWFANLPGFWFEILDSIRTWPYSWFPSAFPTLESWRALTFPLAAMPLWSCVGTGVDYFARLRNPDKRRIRWFALVGSLISLVFGAIILIAGSLDDRPDLHPPAFNRAAMVVGAIWMLLSGLCCAAWIHQTLQRRRERANKIAGASAGHAAQSATYTATQNPE
jgi:hypothetical protein